jgi:hypothetical protein
LIGDWPHDLLLGRDLRVVRRRASNIPPLATARAIAAPPMSVEPQNGVDKRLRLEGGGTSANAVPVINKIDARAREKCERMVSPSSPWFWV